MHPGHAYLLDLTEGAVSTLFHSDLDSWAIIFDATNLPAPIPKDERVLGAWPIANEKYLLRAFQDVFIQCRVPGRSEYIYYFSQEKAYDPDDTRYGNLTRIRVKMALMKLLMVLIEENQPAATSSTTLPASLRKAIIYMESHFGEPAINLDDITHESAISKNHLLRLFRQYVAASPMEYLQRLRLTRSRQLLIDTDMRIYQVALHVGIEDPYYFTRLFQRHYNMSPREFRKANQTNPGG